MAHDSLPISLSLPSSKLEDYFLILFTHIHFYTFTIAISITMVVVQVEVHVPPILLLFVLLPAVLVKAVVSATPFTLPNNDQCTDRCGDFRIPFPYHLNLNYDNSSSSCSGAGGRLHFNAFRLSCLNSTTPYLNIGSTSYRVLEFYSDGVLVDLPGGGGAGACHQYLDINSFGDGFKGNEYYGISIQNVLCLYDCEDSSVCKVDCDKHMLPSSSSKGHNTTCNCCYPLSDTSAWEIGDGFSVFSQYGCRGFSSWILPPSPSPTLDVPKRGIKLEWAIPTNSSSKPVCATNALTVNATTVKAGVRCTCQNGFVGDGFLDGVGCLTSCVKDGHEAYGTDCHVKRHRKMKAVVLAGILVFVFLVASLGVFCSLVRRPVINDKWDSHPRIEQSSLSFQKACRTRVFTYRELEEATKGFEDGQKLIDGVNGTVHSGLLGDGTQVAVQKVQCEDEQNLLLFTSQVEILSQVSHKNVARVLGCCIDSGNTCLVVYEICANGTFEEHLYQGEDQKGGLDWYQRLNIAAETASALAYLQYEIAPPIYHHDLKSASIFLDDNFSVKIAGFGLLNCGFEVEDRACHNSEGSRFYRSDVYDLGVVLLEIIAGSRRVDLPTMALPKIRSGKLEEIVDPRLYYHEQPTFRREQMEIVADLATRCLLFGGDGRLSMMDAARELAQMIKESHDGCSRRRPALEETFSNSSLLQMISMSPDSIYVP